MANALYANWKGSLLTGTASVAVNTNSTQAGMYAVLLSSAYIFDSSNEVFSDISSAYSGAVSTAHYLLVPTVTVDSTGATFDSCDVTFASVGAGSTVVAVLLIRLINNASANALPIAYIDTATGLPLTPNGGNVTVTWASNGIFSISEAAVKENLEYLGHVGPANIYGFNYIGDKKPQVGMIASDVETWCPEAIKVVGGMRHVNYGAALDKALTFAS